MPNNTKSTFFQLLHYIRPFRRDYLAATLYSFLNTFFDLMPEVLLGIAINIVVEKEHSWLARLGFQELKTQLLLLGVMTLLSYSLESTFDYLCSIKWRRLAQDVLHSFRMEAFERVQQSTMAAFSQQKTGNLLAILNEDTNQLEHFFEEGVDKIIELVCSVLFVGGVFFLLSPKIALFVMLPIPLLLYGVFFFANKIGPLYLTAREKAGVLSTSLTNSLLGLLTAKSLVAEEIEVQKIAQVSQAYKEANYQTVQWGALMSPVLRLVIVLGYLVTLTYGGLMTLEGKLDVGTYSMLITMTHRLLWPFTDIGIIVFNFQRVMASTTRLLQLFQLPEEVSPAYAPTIRGKITFSSVSFAYAQPPPTLKDLTFTILPGQTVAFVGATGAGKSTLLKLLLGFHAPTSGTVSFDNQPLSELSLPALRRQLGFVSQESFLFEGTVADNIGYALPDVTQAQIVQAAQNAAAHEFISRLPQGYDTWLGERGQTLSGGQKQRLAIARALVRQPAILILDEATSAVDNETEFAIQQSLSKISQGRTTIIIAHRLSTIRHADHIFVLNHGEIVEQGTHEALLARDYLYANLWKLQTGAHLTHAELFDADY